MFTEKQRKFTLNVFKGVDQPQAYIDAGYKVKSRTVASVNASRLLTNANVQALLNELREKEGERILTETVAVKVEAAQVATEILRARFSDFMDNEGNIDFSNEGLKSPALSEVKVSQFVGGKEGRAKQTARTIKLRDPLAAADYLAKLYGWYDNSYIRDINVMFVIGKGYSEIEGEKVRYIEGKDATE